MTYKKLYSVECVCVAYHYVKNESGEIDYTQKKAIKSDTIKVKIASDGTSFPSYEIGEYYRTVNNIPTLTENKENIEIETICIDFKQTLEDVVITY